MQWRARGAYGSPSRAARVPDARGKEVVSEDLPFDLAGPRATDRSSRLLRDAHRSARLPEGSSLAVQSRSFLRSPRSRTGSKPWAGNADDPILELPAGELWEDVRPVALGEDGVQYVEKDVWLRF